MKIFYLFFFTSLLFTQEFSESISSNSIKFKVSGDEYNGSFIAIPNIPYTVIAQKNIQFKKAFTRRNNLYFELEKIEADGEIEFKFQQPIASFLRRADGLSLNQLFVKAKQISQKKSVGNTYKNDSRSIKVYTVDEGVYRLTFEYFKEHEIDIDEYIAANIRMINDDVEIPIFVETGLNSSIDAPGDYILFYADKHLNHERNKYPDVHYDPYDYRNIYWITESNSLGKRLYEKNGSTLEQTQSKIFKPRFFNQFVHLENQNYLGQRAIPNIESELRNRGINGNGSGALYHMRDYYFWNNEIDEGIFKSFDVSILDNFFAETGDRVKFSVMMSGGAVNISGNHIVEFKVSSGTYQTPDNLNWVKSHSQRVDFEIPVNLLKTENTFEVKTVSQNDRTLLNFIELEFKSRFKALNNELRFLSPESESTDYTVYQYNIEGFTHPDIRILKRNESIITNASIVLSNGLYSIQFQDEIENENAEFYIYTQNLIKEPVQIKQNNSFNRETSIFDYTTESQMLIITTKLFESVANNYANYKTETTGLKTEVILDEWIYNEFNQGNQSPVAIRSFIKYAYENWSSTNELKYILFIGDAKRDYRSGIGKDNIIPTFQYVSYNRGFTASDSYYSYLYHSNEDFLDFNNNPINDVYVGRIPAETISEFQSYFDKVREYDSNPPEIMNLFLSGNDYSPSSSNREFSSDDRVFLSQLSRINLASVSEENFTIMRRAADDPPESTRTELASSTQLINLFNSGFNYMTFMGHGAGAVWGDRNIMVQEDAKRLNNQGRYPIILSMTCFVGAFDGAARTLGEVMLLEPNKGVVGLLSASGVSVLYNQYMLGYYLNEVTYKNQYSYGEIISLGKFKYFSKGGNYLLDKAIVNTPEHFLHKYLLLLEFNYIGDPSLSVKIPKKAELNLNDNFVSEDSQLDFQLQNLGVDVFNEIGIQLLDYFGEIVKDTVLFSVNVNDSINLTLDVDELTQPDIYFLKGYAKSDNNVYNFGQRLDKVSNIEGELVGLENSSLEFSDIYTDSLFRFEYLVETGIDSIIAKAFAYTYDHVVGQVFEEIHFEKSGNRLITTDDIYIDEDIVSIDFIEMLAFVGGEQISLRNQSLDVIPSKFVIKPLENSFSINYKDNTELFLNVTLPISDRDNLKVYIDYFSNSLSEEKASSLIATDSIEFVRRNTTRTSRVFIDENYTGDSIIYEAVLRTNFPELELTPEEQSITSDVYHQPVFKIENTQINTSVSLNAGLNIDFDLPTSRFNGTSLVSLNLIDNPNLNLSDVNLFNGKLIELIYHDDDFSFVDVDQENFTIKIDKEIWKSKSLDRIVLNYYDIDLNTWIEFSTVKNIESDSSLFISPMNGMVESGIYSIVEKSNFDPVKVNLSFDLNGNSTDSIEFSSVNPAITVNLISQSTNYTPNPQNITIELFDKQTNIATPVEYTYSYSGPDNQKLTLITNTVIGDGNFEMIVKVNGYIDLRDKNDRKYLDNTAKQTLSVSGNDNLTFYGNYPNPFNEKTIFVYKLESSSSVTSLDVSLKIYTLSGHLIKQINNSNVVNSKSYDENILLPGVPQTGRIGMNYIRWNGRDDFGNEVANGVYFVKIVYRSSDETFEKVVKVVKIKGIEGN